MVSVTFLSLLGSFTLFSNVLATVFMTSPTVQTTCTGGQQCTISWNDDGKAPTAVTFGLASIGIFVGSVNSQTEIQRIQDGVNVATTAAVQFTVDPSIGPNSNVYFVRFTSAAAKDPNNVAYPAEAFSAKFTLNGMKGTFNSTIQAQIDGASSAPVPSPSAPATSAAPPSQSTGAAKPTSSPSSSSKTSGTVSAVGAAKTGAAASVSVKNSMIGLLGASILFALAL